MNIRTIDAPWQTEEWPFTAHGHKFKIIGLKTCEPFKTRVLIQWESGISDWFTIGTIKTWTYELVNWADVKEL